MSRSSFIRFAAPAALFALAVTACGSNNSLGKGTVVKDAAPCTPSVSASPTADAPTVAKPATIPKTLLKKDLKVNSKGCAAAANSYLRVQYVGILAKTGKVFTSSWTDGKPLEFLLGANRVIPGWETGLTGMTVGSRRSLVVPAAQAYGKTGLAAKGIGPNEPLAFVIDLISTGDAPTVCSPQSIPAAPNKPTNIKIPATPPKTLVKTDLKVGTGAAATKKSYVKIQIYGVSCSSGSQIFSTWDAKPADPITATLGTPTAADQAASVSSLIPGVTTGIVGMKVGGIRQIDIPSAQAYGTQGQPPDIGPNDPLTFVVQLVSVQAKRPAAPTTTTSPATTPASTTTTAAKGTTTTAPKGTTTTAKK